MRQRMGKTKGRNDINRYQDWRAAASKCENTGGSVSLVGCEKPEKAEGLFRLALQRLITLHLFQQELSFWP